MTTIANYDYGFAYHLYPDGTIESAIKLTGALSTGVFSFEEQVCPFPVSIHMSPVPRIHSPVPPSTYPFIYPHIPS